MWLGDIAAAGCGTSRNFKGNYSQLVIKGLLVYVMHNYMLLGNISLLADAYWPGIVWDVISMSGIERYRYRR